MSEDELRTAFTSFDRNKDGSIEFAEVVDFLCPRVRTHRDAQREVHVQHLQRQVRQREELVLPMGGSGGDDDGMAPDGISADVSAAVSRIAESIFERELQVQKLFRKWDRNGDGALDTSEFTSALNALGFSIDLTDARTLFRHFDLNNDGKVACWEFVRTLAAYDPNLNAGPIIGHNTGLGGGGDAIRDDRKLPPPPPPPTDGVDVPSSVGSSSAGITSGMPAAHAPSTPTSRATARSQRALASSRSRVSDERLTSPRPPACYNMPPSPRADPASPYPYDAKGGGGAMSGGGDGISGGGDGMMSGGDGMSGGGSGYTSHGPSAATRKRMEERERLLARMGEEKARAEEAARAARREREALAEAEAQMRTQLNEQQMDLERRRREVEALAVEERSRLERAQAEQLSRAGAQAKAQEVAHQKLLEGLAVQQQEMQRQAEELEQRRAELLAQRAAFERDASERDAAREAARRAEDAMAEQQAARWAAEKEVEDARERQRALASELERQRAAMSQIQREAEARAAELEARSRLEAAQARQAAEREAAGLAERMAERQAKAMGEALAHKMGEMESQQAQALERMRQEAEAREKAAWERAEAEQREQLALVIAAKEAAAKAEAEASRRAAEIQREAMEAEKAKAKAEAAATEHAARLRAERAATERASREAEQMQAQVEEERRQREALQQELDALKAAQFAAQEKRRREERGFYDLQLSGLVQWEAPSSQTDLTDKCAFMWSATLLDDSLTDAQILSTIRKRLRSVHVTPQAALAACVGESRLAKDPSAYSGHGVDPAVLLAFTAQLLYNLSDPRAAKLLMGVSGGLPIVAVPRFLQLLTSSDPADVARQSAANTDRMAPIRTTELTARERGLLLSLRDYLFEQRSKVRTLTPHVLEAEAEL